MRRIIKVLAWILLALAGILAIACLAIAAINRNDRPPSAAATRFVTLASQLPQVREQDNGFVYLLGFGAERGQDPVVLGAQRITWAQHATKSNDAGMTANFPTRDYDPSPARSAAMKALIGSCKRVDRACLAALDEGANVDESLAAEGWLLERYRALISRAAWRETMPMDMRLPFPSYSLVLDGQRLLLLQAWRDAGRGDARAVKALLERDGVFWRRALASSDLLISKMIAAAALARNFEWGNLAMRRMPGSDAVPEHWRTPISDTERSMLRTSVGEFMFVTSTTRFFRSDLTAAWDPDGEDTSFKGLVTAILMPTFQRQDGLNRYADLAAAVADTLTVPYEELPVAVARARALVATASAHAFDQPLYNWPGKALLAESPPDFIDYALRVADLEGLRRLALLAAQMRQSKTSPGEVQGKLAAAPLRDPYDGKPFGWDASAATLVFTGLGRLPRGRHALLY